ncbi:MAG: hypothetical protein RMJ52_11175 [Gemmataceae bacterium]|nr:hypothetical protein [Gemmataceae bacterium]
MLVRLLWLALMIGLAGLATGCHHRHCCVPCCPCVCCPPCCD